MKTVNYILFILFVVVFHLSHAQEIQIFTLQDFDLKNQVKSCLVSTDYGKEEYDFNKKGFLTKSVTRYSDSDYDVVYYKFKDTILLEKRSESYRENTFDPSTSIAHFYTTDSLNQSKIQERIFSYDKEFLDEYIYLYDDTGDLISIQHINNEGKDETLVEYKKYKGEETITYLLNGVPVKSVRSSIMNPKNKAPQKVILTKEYLKGQANIAFEEVYNLDDRLMAQQEFKYDSNEQKFVPTVRTTFVYDDNNMLVSETSKEGELSLTKEYIYQYDNIENGNWIKQIVTPDNTYTTRKITYYAHEKVLVKEE